jgi:cation diffusion facilitator CzcD-associated flavoprotein CzcO
MNQPGTEQVLDVAIIGSGFSGICMGIQLKKMGIHSFAILEKADRVGGTWRDNTYPGAACDSPSFCYCFSFEQKTDWSRKWSPQAEILDYIEHCARKYGLLPHVRFRTELASAGFDAEAGVWRLRSRDGEEIAARILISGTGQLNRPSVPAIPGLETFRGERFHSARWNHGYDLTGKRVASIGNAASAIQFIPQIAPRVERLYVFQRSANWMIPKFDRPYREWEKRLFGWFPLAARLYRWWLYLQYESMFPIFRRNRFFSARMSRKAEEDMRSRVSDPKLQEVLVPDYPIGGKRILISDDYYASLERENVEVVTTSIDRVTEDSIITSDGAAHRVDAIILATGFESTSFLAPIEIEGLDGRRLDKVWKQGAEAYLGTSVSGFPNFFMLYGPNTNLGHNSIIFMIECQVQYVVDCIRKMNAADLKYVDVRPEVMRAYNERLQAELEKSVWAATPRSWYKTKEGRITNNWSGTTIRYWWNTRHADLGVYHQEAKKPAADLRVASAA